jgi:hypothetical protein
MKKRPGKRRPKIERDDILHIVVLEPDVAEVFPTATAVHEALRALARIIRDQRRCCAVKQRIVRVRP